MPQDFILKVQNLISHNLEGSNLRGTLAKLTVKDGLTEKMCVSQFKPKRGGDYCTVMQGFIILYLPSCREGELAITLEHTFNTPQLRYLRLALLYIHIRKSFQKSKILDQLSLIPLKM